MSIQKLKNSRCSHVMTEMKQLIISEYFKLAQKGYKIMHDWIGKVIHWELCKRLKFNHANKWYKH